MGPAADQQIGGKFSEKVPPRFDGHEAYEPYSEDIFLWVNLTTLPPAKHGAVVIGSLLGEEKYAAKTISTEETCREGGVEFLLQRLEKEYEIEETNQLKNDLYEFLDYTWKKEVSAENFISEFRTRADKISELDLNDNLKGHLLLR